MILDIKTIREVTQGVVDIEEKDGNFVFYRFTPAEAETTDNKNVLKTAGVVMEFTTDADNLKFAVNTRDDTDVRSYFCFDIFEDGKLVATPANFDTTATLRDYAGKKYPLGRFEFDVKLNSGEKCLKIVFPHSVVAELEYMELANATYIQPVKPAKKLLAYGDSITQGYDALHPSNAYVMRLAEHMGAELISKALGGARFAPEIIHAETQADVDFVLVAYGTNDWWWCGYDEIAEAGEKFIRAVESRFAGKPIFVLSPIWRNNWQEKGESGDFMAIDALLRGICKGRDNVKFIPGFDLVPHDRELFGDLGLHPSDEGFRHYFENLTDCAGL